MITNNKGILNLNHLAFLLFLIVGGFFLWTEHRAHIMGALPYLILLLCPLMHIFMHKGHGEHGKHDNHNNKQGGSS